MNETLYPHEVFVKYFLNNIFKFDATFAFIFGGMFGGIFLTKYAYNIPTNYSMLIFTCIILIISGAICQYLDYKYRGLN